MRVALPWRLTESEQEIAWDQIIFDNTLLGQVPEEGVSRLVTQQISERRDHYIRYGLAFMLEHGFMKTDRGRLCYRMNLEQARFVESLLRKTLEPPFELGSAQTRSWRTASSGFAEF